ncbi:avidin-like [Eleutherodactylus coqui]|uniref:avidin-like n=1 Tax=Eleutherodactylus coqui TaxID=57060 RepID=UPI0034629B17
MAIIYLKDAYYHIPIPPDSQQLLWFELSIKGSGSTQNPRLQDQAANFLGWTELQTLSITAFHFAQCNLAGQWKNDLGSYMTISVLPCGMFSGSYLTSVSTTKNKVGESPLIGFHQINGHPTFGFTVQWASSNSTTVFTGQCYRDESGPFLKTMWLLRSESEDINDDWNQMRVGYDTFWEFPTPDPKK